jgi:hypothetical protein
MKFCYCTLALGDRYVKLARVFLDSYVKHVQTQTQVIVVTDHPDVILDHPRVKQVQFNRAIKGAPISLKWLPYHHALKAGFESICFVDVDSVVSEKYDEQSILDDLREDGFGCNWYLTYKQEFNNGGLGTRKLKQLIRSDDQYPIVCPVECFMFLHGNRDRSVKFINEWRTIQQELSSRGLYHREVCHEIGLAAKRVNLPVYKYKRGRNTYLSNFSHYGSPRGKIQMLS